jgi:hypothetical protein
LTRISTNKHRYGCVWHGFDYNLQVWVIGGIVQRCSHPDTMRLGGKPCCNAYRFAGQRILNLPVMNRRDTRHLTLVKK